MVPKRFGSVAPLILVVLTFAGCVDGEQIDPAAADLPDAEVATFDDASGAIEGYVIDDESFPLAGATVGIRETEVQTLSDSDGKFTFSNLAPATYTVDIQRLGYESELRRVTVEVGAVTNVQISLTGIIVREPYSETFDDTGYFQCSTQLAGSSGPCGFVPVAGSTPVQDLWTENRRHWVYMAREGSISIFNEMTWDQGSFATGDTLKVTFSYENRTTTHWYCNAVGVKPVVMRWERGFDDRDPDWDGPGECVDGTSQLPSGQPESIPMEGQELRSFVNTGPSQHSGSAGFAYEQRFEIWFSLFYWEPAPDDYSALPDS